MNPHASTLYIPCPGCAERTLILRDARGIRCAGCAFDYQALAGDRPRFEAYLVDRLREGPMSQLGAIALAQWTSDRPPAESTAALRALAESHGVALPAPADPAAFVRTVMIGVAVGLFALIALGLYAASTGS